MASISFSKAEVVFFVLSFFILFRSTSYLFVCAGIGLSTFFFLKRKEFYFLWSIIAPRITGSAVCMVVYLITLIITFEAHFGVYVGFGS